MLIYRVEHPTTGYGPFTGGTGGRVRGLRGCAPTHPEPQQDGIDFYFGWLVGCQSMALLCHWFCDAWRDLEHQGFVVRVYRAINPAGVKLGGKQCAFSKDNVELIGTQPVHTMLDCYDTIA
jgi:hypothetical protein